MSNPILLHRNSRSKWKIRLLVFDEVMVAEFRMAVMSTVAEADGPAEADAMGGVAGMAERVVIGVNDEGQHITP